jgi:Ca-activated chloride channel family protein
MVMKRKKIAVSAADFSTITLKRATTSNSSRRYKLASLTKDLRRETQQLWFAGDETYASIIENGFVQADKYPSTGLTLNVDRASYSNIRRFLNTKTIVPPDAVRIEEMLNYFNLDYHEPRDKKTFEINTALTNCPWNINNQLLFATIRSKKVSLDSLPATHLVFLIDISGSMDMPNRLPLLKSGFRGLVNNLRKQDSVSIVVYGGVVGIMLNATSGAEKQKIFNVIDSLQPGGSTPGESGIKLAYSVARKHFIKNGNNRVILATDGDFNVGLRSEEELEEMIIAQRESGIYLTCLGVGMGNYKDSKIQTLAQKGNGNFAYIDNYSEAEKTLLKEFVQTLYTVADDVYLNVNFDPAYVKDYRLIGFDNKVGAIKDSLAIIEGGEIGSGYTMIVSFEIVPTSKLAEPGIKQPVSFRLKYKLPRDKKENEVIEKPLIEFCSLQQQDKFYQFASTIISFGSLLRDSKYIKETSWNEIIDLATLSADVDQPTQQEFILLLQQAKLIYNKKVKKNFLIKINSK